MNTNQTNPLVVKHYDNTYQVCVDLGAYARANAPDQKSRNKVRKVVSSHSDLPYARALLCYLGCVFNQWSERSYYKAEGLDVPNKHITRADFYRRLADWANACYDLVKEAPVITTNIDAHSSGPQFDVPEKDAEDDSDPYVKPSPKADQVEHALTQLKTRLTLADFGKQRIDSAAALFRSVVLERPIGATVLDVLERFGDEASELSWNGEYDAACFWDACVQISDDLRGDLAADQIKKASTVTVPEPDAVLWEVTDDPNRALYRTEKDAMRATRELFPDEFVTLRYARLRRRNVKTFK